MTTAPVPAADTTPASTVPRHLGLRMVLIIAALLEGFDAVSSVPTFYSLRGVITFAIGVSIYWF